MEPREKMHEIDLWLLDLQLKFPFLKPWLRTMVVYFPCIVNQIVSNENINDKSKKSGDSTAEADFKKLGQKGREEEESAVLNVRKWCNGHLKSDTIFHYFWWERTLPSPFSTLNAVAKQ